MVFEQVRHKPGCTSTEDGKRLEILDLERRRSVLSMYINIKKTKALINFARTADLRLWFRMCRLLDRCSYETAHIIIRTVLS